MATATTTVVGAASVCELQALALVSNLTSASRR
jgi:hypothetical protein